MRWAAAPGQPPTPYRAPPPPVKKGGGCLKWVLLLMGGAFLFCCCISAAVVESANDPLDWKAVVPTTSSASLGLALMPGDLSPDQARQYKWRQSLAAYELGYGLSTEVHEQVESDFADMAERYSYKPGKGNNFTWAPPIACRKHEWQCVFDELVRDNAEDIAPLTELFRRKQQEKNLDSRQLTELVVSFVQNITYRLPTEDTAAFGMLPPAIVVADGSGDCDSKALLAVVILRQLNVDAVVLLASGLGHAALGVALPVTGKKFPYQGKKYAFVEVTTPGWALGHLPPEYDVDKAWKVIPVEVQ
ncbi:MAG: hypothetical protein Q8N23_30010 [Archangium sp.]|nr:hypothetical protein [Archangium sp.]MDP3575624.1 hypothetical protein [Archangium sp.]